MLKANKANIAKNCSIVFNINKCLRITARITPQY